MTRACQESGIWAWDCVHQEAVLVIPSVLAMLGDNPMQSELACHIGLQGKMFCRVCWVEGDEHEDIEDERESLLLTAVMFLTNNLLPEVLAGRCRANSNASSVDSMAGPSGDDRVSITQPNKRKRAQKKKESMGDMISRITRFMNVRVILL